MGCENCVNGEADTKPFSIRQFVVDTRRKDIFHCWPFPEKYLQICLKYGISNVLPPFEPCNSATQTTIGTVGSQQDKENVFFENKVRDIIVQEKLIKDESNSYYNEVLSKAPCLECLKSHLDNSCKHKDESNLSTDYTSNAIVPVSRQSSSVQSSYLNVYRRINSPCPKRLRHKRRKHKGRQKKRSMLDILARAKLCTLEDIYRIRCNPINVANEVVESSRLMAHVEDIKDDDEASNDNLSSKKSRSPKIKFGECISKSWNIS
ncbi:uncharacterized protein LOC111307259 isoform X2 [Durio zibethinus]|uniref:Uncharacterized protein LOC111307259 isoform X2 n=1 Tax=Durio zibethinus TaxID=66656 RepID=A0A6P6A7W7_DURZI|nr:uncharacterized protein LOC111307259 isoform X2 [Durio zibethinus]